MCQVLKPQEDCRAVSSFIAPLENLRSDDAENQLQELVWSEIFSNNMIIGFGGTSFDVSYVCAQVGQQKRKRLCACPELHSTPVIGQPKFGSKSDFRRH